ncbi:MAG: DUF2855 family protein [Pseudomonadota bacterium]
MPVRQHWIDKTSLRDAKWVEKEIPIENGQLRLSVDAFALTANNVTYAAFGDSPLQYWRFFRTDDASMGRVPVWGFGTVTASKFDDIKPGRRVYGYFPISETLIVEPTHLTEAGFVDGAEHRQGAAPIYNTYQFTDQDPAYEPEYESEQMLFRPLYLTGWSVADCIAEGSPKPDTAIVSSASSKTAIATAHGLKRFGIKTIGLTSQKNRDFVVGTGLYDETFSYEDVPSLPGSGAIAFADYAGSPQLTAAVHASCGNGLIRSITIGATDWEADRSAPPTDLPGPTPEFFFVPDYIVARAKELPPGEINRRMLKDLVAFYPVSRDFVTAETVLGEDAIAQAWREIVNGDIAPNRGLICKFE